MTTGLSQELRQGSVAEEAEIPLREDIAEIFHLLCIHHRRCEDGTGMPGISRGGSNDKLATTAAFDEEAGAGMAILHFLGDSSRLRILLTFPWDSNACRKSATNLTSCSR